MTRLKELQNKIVDLDEAKKRIAEWKAAGDKVVFTNGCFDILHRGHVTYLAEAADLGTKLIVGLNSDASVTRLKGPNRPIQDQTAREYVMASLASVDLVVPFAEDTPLNLITALLPDVLVKGGDYTIDTIVGAKEVMENGGEVKTIPVVKGYSTTNIEDKMK